FLLGNMLVHTYCYVGQTAREKGMIDGGSFSHIFPEAVSNRGHFFNPGVFIARFADKGAVSFA
ncbi:MAG TPA: hypothetical protein DD811_13430, partial [Syntrophomonas sp.]|nr:hypothetical protein [Syntrophomonas sp.]